MGAIFQLEIQTAFAAAGKSNNRFSCLPASSLDSLLVECTEKTKKSLCLQKQRNNTQCGALKRNDQELRHDAENRLVIPPRTLFTILSLGDVHYVLPARRKVDRSHAVGGICQMLSMDVICLVLHQPDGRQIFFTTSTYT